MRAYEIRRGSSGLDGLENSERPDPIPCANELLIRIRAASINSRDPAILAGRYFSGPVTRNLIPLSDGCGEVISVGKDVTRFSAGARIAGAFFQGWVDGPPSATRAALGNPLDGMLAEYAVLPEDGVVAIPEELTFEEGATLPCAGVTAWNALMATGRNVKRGETVLILGTGGVSTMAIVFAKVAGARVIVTSSSDEKLSKIRELGVDHLINYKRNPEWGKEVLDMTSDRGGADHIVETGGSGTLRKSLQAIAPGGKVAVVGALTGFTSSLNLFDLMSKNVALHGISVGPRRLFEEMNRAISTYGMRPVIDKVFPFEEAREAFRYQAAGTFVGKIVISV